ncbi:MAG: FAD-binding oxidoreductase [Tannerellaceae bacterium]|nr:FAD-binding oxidoreductase [Tannerellaceae bacterium]
MDLYSGLPYWIAKNPLYNYFNPLTAGHSTDVVIIGGGITGALVAHELCKSGIRCTLVNKSSIATGSTTASTALLQYEIDTPLCKLSEMIGEKEAVMAYQACLRSIADIEEVGMSIEYDADFERVPSIFYASTPKDVGLLRKEYEIRTKHTLPVGYLDTQELYTRYHLVAPAALVNNASAQIDAYAMASHLIDYHLVNSGLKVYTHTPITQATDKGDSYELQTASGYRINCQYVIIAAGFEAGKFLPQEIMQLTSTYAIVSQPVEEKYLWPGKSLIWETQEPYLYIRTTNGNRVIVGGEDEPFKDPLKRDNLLRKKIEILQKKIKKIFPSLPFVTDMAWCGTFSCTPDGLPFIGPWPGNDKMLYALGYGGNGITFSMIAAQVIRNRLCGIKDEREKVFGYRRFYKE